MKTQTSSIQGFLPIAVAGVLSVILLSYFAKGNEQDNDFNALALGKETTTYLAFNEGNRIHCHDIDDSDKCILNYIRNKDGKDLVLWLGNSQLHAINQMQIGDRTASALLHSKLSELSKYLMVFSQPNANLQEHFLMFEYVNSKLPVSTLILPLVYDDTRETGIRHSIMKGLEDPELVENFTRTSFGQEISIPNEEVPSTQDDFSGLKNTIQDRVERMLNENLSSVWEVWDSREFFRGELYSSMYKIRNWVFGINASSIRRKIPGRYSLNLEALAAIYASACDRNIQVLAYVAPLRNDVDIPYSIDDYNQFKTDAEALADCEDIKFVDLDYIVSGEHWGSKASTSIGESKELDFMHFTYRGHEILAGTLGRQLTALWTE